MSIPPSGTSDEGDFSLHFKTVLVPRRWAGAGYLRWVWGWPSRDSNLHLQHSLASTLGLTLSICGSLAPFLHLHETLVIIGLLVSHVQICLIGFCVVGDGDKGFHNARNDLSMHVNYPLG